MRIRLKNFYSFLVVSLCVWLAGCSKDPDTPGKKYLHFLNHYQADSLQYLLSPDFRLKPTYTSYVYKREDFFSIYLRNYRVYQQKTSIIRQLSYGESETFLVVDNSEYLRLLDVTPPTFKITVHEKENIIDEVIVDTTEKTRQYFTEIKAKSEKFREWLNMKYPSENLRTLHETDGLFLLRLNEYRKTLKVF